MPGRDGDGGPCSANFENISVELLLSICPGGSFNLPNTLSYLVCTDGDLVSNN